METMLLRGEAESCSLRVSSTKGSQEQRLACEAEVLRAQQLRRALTKSFSATQSKGGLVRAAERVGWRFHLEKGVGRQERTGGRISSPYLMAVPLLGVLRRLLASGS